MPMERDAWEKIERLYHSALSLDPEKRAEFLKQACGEDAALRIQVERLLREQPDAESLFAAPAAELAARVLMQDTNAISPNTQLGHYRILKELGSGGMGKVYLSQDTRLDRKVAIKFFRAPSPDDEMATKRLIREARAAAKLDHANICAIHEVAEMDGRSFMVMQYVEGETLGNRLQRGPLGMDETLDIASQVVDGLSEAHARGIIHCDLKPQNIMITAKGQVKILDFGVAKVVRETHVSASLVETGARSLEFPGVAGTLSYMSPEQVQGRALDVRSDIFSLGIVFYEMVCGRRPFVEDSGAATIAAILTKEPPSFTGTASTVPEELQRIVLKCLEKNPDLRYQSVRELWIDLQRCRKGRGAQGTISPAAPGRRTGLQRYALAAVVTLLLAGIAGGAYWLFSRREVIYSVAVMPFDNASADETVEYLSDGITEGIIRSLSKLSDLKVTSRAAVFRFKGKEIDIPELGEKLGVDAVLTGRVLKRADALTIQWELVDARDSSRISGEQYDRRVADLLALQQQIPLDISESLRPALGGNTRARVGKRLTENPEAYQLYLQGRYAQARYTLEMAKAAIQYFEQAIAKDPRFAAAHSGIADAQIGGTGTGIPAREATRVAREHVSIALKLDPDLAEAHTSLAGLLLREWNFSGAESAYKRAIELSPSYIEAHHSYSHFLILVGRFDESLVESRKVEELDPLSDLAPSHLAFHYHAAGDFPKAMQYYQTALGMVVDQANQRQVGDLYFQQGNFNEAFDWYMKALTSLQTPQADITALNVAFKAGGIAAYFRKRMEQIKRKSSPASRELDLVFAALHARLGEKDQAFEWLEKAFDNRDPGLNSIKTDPVYESLRSDKRFTDLVRRIGIPS